MPIPPTTKKISHPFGEYRGKRLHNGIDYDVVKGTPVKASADGIVVRSDEHLPTERIVLKKQVNNMGEKEKKFFGSYGNVIIIYHGQDLKKLKYTYTLYAHLDHRSVRANEEVKEGQMIATCGRSGTRQGFYNHKGGYELHFEVLQSKKMLNWVKTGDLDFQFAEESWRINPERFFRCPFGLSLRLPVPYYKLPAGLDFIKNIKEAKKMNIIPDDKIYSITTANMTLKMIETILEGTLFANAVRPGGRWDMRHTYGQSGLTRVELTNLGNYNYGLTGAAAGYSSFVLHRMADLIQLLTGKFEWEYLPQLDNPQDTAWINRGIEDYKTGMWKQGASGCI